MGFRPFTGDTVSDLPCWAGAEPPTGPEEFAILDGGVKFFLVALA